MSVILRVGAVKPNGNQELHYGSGDEASSSYTDADVLDIPLPEHTYQRPLPPTSAASQSNTGYTGLPYQDHNYGMPPPPSPPRPPSPRPPSPFEDNGMVQMEEEVKTTPLVSVVEEVVEDSVTRCICGYLHDDGYMICCDKCSVWQHIDCMGVDRNNIPDSYFCELCQPRVLDAVKAKAMQKRKREELAARNVLSDSSATDTDPEEAANALASMGKKLPPGKKKSLKQKRNTKTKEKPPLKLKIRKALAQKVKKPGKKEKENITSTKPPKKLVKTASGQKVKTEKSKNRTPLTLEQMTGDPWNSNFSPWVDSYDYAQDNKYSPSVKDFRGSSAFISQAVDISSIMPDQLHAHLTCVAEVKKNRKGLRALQEIPAGQAIIEYKGKVMLRQDYDREHGFDDCVKRLQPFVLFYSQAGVDLCVDARAYGNEARFIRRSCTPNAEVKHILAQGKLYFVVLSKKDIMCGFEVTIPFDYNYQDCSFCVECACMKNNCVVSRYWKKMKSLQKAQQKEGNTKRKRQTSGSETSKGFDSDMALSPPVGSPRKNSMSSPLKSPLPSPSNMINPVKLSNVSTLLAASALLDGQLDLASHMDLDVTEPLQSAPLPPTPTPHKAATSSRRSSRVSEDSVKEEKTSACPPTPTKDKASKFKDSKSKGKEKDNKVFHCEIKKERRLSARRQSQDDDDVVDPKADSSSTAHSSGPEAEDSPGAAAENLKKMTREERKLDAIMKVFEKMEKREERRKEAMARGDQGTKRNSTDTKVQKREEGGSTQSRSNSQDGLADSSTPIKEEPSSNSAGDPADKPEDSKPGEDQPKLPEIKCEKTEELQPRLGGRPDGSGPGVSLGLNTHEARLGSLDSSTKITRRSGKRKRRRSRAHSTAVVSDVASVTTDDGSSNASFPPAPLSMPVTPASTPATTPLPSEDVDAGVFKYVKTKKHLFDEWSHKHEDETKQEMFVQCLPNPHVNTMDHLQRRNSQSCPRGSEASGGSAKKRWLRQAMHEVPAPVAFNHSLSVSTDGSASPVHGSSSPNPALGSPGAGSPLDFVTPLKKRRLIRESLSNEITTSPSPGVLAESLTTNGVGIKPKTNGVKHMFPATRHSTDDRMFLHKGYLHKNGFSETVLLPENSEASTSSSVASVASQNCLATERQTVQAELSVNSDSAWRAEPRANGFAEAVPVPVSSFGHSAPSSSFPLKFRGLRVPVEHSSENFQEKEAASTSSRNVQANSSLNNSVLSRQATPSSSSCPLKQTEGMEIDSPVSMPPVVVVNSNVYNGVNSLMEAEGSEAGCVTAKSILNEDSPATVRVDLNTHGMEPPSSLSDSSSNVVVNLDDSLFSMGLQGEQRPPDTADCQVNSSEDVEAYPAAKLSVNICDNVCTNSSASRLEEVRRERVDGANVVDSSQQVAVARNGPANVVAEDSNSREVVAGMSASCLQPVTDTADCISSSGQPCLPPVDRVVVQLNAVCDSADNSSMDERHSDWTLERQCTSQSTPAERVEVSHDSTAREEGVRADNIEDSNCDSAEPGSSVVQKGHARLDLSNRDVTMADSNAAESPCTSANAMDSNVDSTSSEAKQTATPAPPAAEVSVCQDSFCDSNSDSALVVRNKPDNSANLDDSSSESLGVSSSQACASGQQKSQPQSAEEEAEGNSSRQGFSSENEAVSNNAAFQELGVTSETEAASGQDHETEQQGMDHPTESAAASSQSKSLSQLAPAASPSSVSSSPSSSLLLLPSPLCSPTSPTSSSQQQAQVTTSPISSSMEAAPAAKKKVSLLEYRKRLKEKPAATVSEAKATSSSSKATSLSSSSSSSSPSLTTTHHKLSTTLSLFLSGSSPTSSFSSSSSSSISPSKVASSSHSTNHGVKKSRMPTLATLPLFKSSEAKKEEKKKLKPKPEKPLSLTERLRLEFGLEDVDEVAKRKKPEEFEVASSSGSIDESEPPPPPPPAVGLYSVPVAGGSRFGSSVAARPLQGTYIGSSTHMMNGVRSSYAYHQPPPQQQQATISSTSLNLPPPVGVPVVDQPVGYMGPPPIHSVAHHRQPSSSGIISQAVSTSWGASALAGPSSTTHRAMIAQTAGGSGIKHGLQHFGQRQHSQTLGEEEQPPPPPPPPRPHHHHHHSSSSSLSSSSHRYHSHQGSSGKNKNSKAAASSSSSSSSRYTDNRSRY